MPTLPSSLNSEELPVLQVSEAINLVNTLLADLELKVEGEVAGYSLSRGKFIFFDLKDEKEEARLSCFMMSYQVSMPLEDGMRVVVRARLGLYQKSGQFRLSVIKVEPKGQGSLKRAFDLLCAKLEKEGLFAPERKRRLPRFVERVGVISSSEAAGFGDFKKIALQRLPGVSYVLANVAVQGKDAEDEICRAFEYLNTYHQLDAIVLIRGGGSMEDLHAFNSELVARAIVRSKAPVVVGVGHERDSTIADYCADLRAATPSNAAQLLLPTREEVELVVQQLTQQGRLYLTRSLSLRKEQIAQRVVRLKDKLFFTVENQRAKVTNLLKSIETLSPEETLKRGYSITCDKDGKPLKLKNVKSGDLITTRLLEGTLNSIIK